MKTFDLTQWIYARHIDCMETPAVHANDNGEVLVVALPSIYDAFDEIMRDSERRARLMRLQWEVLR
jgi:hypothetical protein